MFIWLWTFYFMWILFCMFSILFFLDFGYFLLTAEEGYFVVPLFTHLIPCAYIFSQALFVKRCIQEDFSVLFFYVGSKQMSYFPEFLQNMCNSFLWYSAGLTITNTNTMHMRAIKINKFLIIAIIKLIIIYNNR